MTLQKRCQSIHDIPVTSKHLSRYSFAQPVTRSFGAEVEVEGKRLVTAASNDFLGLSHDPRIREAASSALRRWGSGPGGSRLLNGNMSLHEQLEEHLASLYGKRGAVLYTTGFLALLGTIIYSPTPRDVVLCDAGASPVIRECCRVSNAGMVCCPHGDMQALRAELARQAEASPEANLFYVCEGVNVLTGETADYLPELAALKNEFPQLFLLVDESYGLGAIGPDGKGLAASLGLAREMDFILGTFDTALSSLGGFVVSDETDALYFLKHNAKSLVFSAALPAGNAAAALAALDILEREPERVARFQAHTSRAREQYESLGISLGGSVSPVLCLPFGSEQAAIDFSEGLFQRGVYAPPTLFPLVPRGRALIRTSFMSIHEEGQVDRVLSAVSELAENNEAREYAWAGLEGMEFPVPDSASGALSHLGEGAR